MKKLILTKTNFQGVEPLTRSQLKNVMGGNGSGTSGENCTSDGNCSSGEWCCYNSAGTSRSCVTPVMYYPSNGAPGLLSCPS